MKKQLCLVLIFISFVFQYANPQTSSAELQEKGDHYYSKKKYSKAIEYYQAAIETEEKKSEPDGYTLAVAYEYLAYSYYGNDNYNMVPDLFEKAISYYRQEGYLDESMQLIPWIASFYKYAMSIDYNFDIPQWDQTVSDNVYFRIQSIEEDLGSTVIVSIDAGQCDGIFEYAKGQALGSYKEEFKGRENIELGTIEIIEITKNTAKGRITLKNPDDPICKVYEGDMVQIPAYIPNRSFRSVFYSLALLNIDFLNVDSEPLYHIRHIINYDGPEMENDILRIMKQDVRETGELIRSMILDNPSWGEPLDSGRYKGRSLVEIMENCSVDDVYAFLLFVKSFPAKYMGHSWKINETFATWVFNYSPIGYDEFKNIVWKAEKEDLAGIAQIYRDDIINDFYINMQTDANDLAYKGQFDKAYNYNDIFIELTIAIGDDRLIGWSFFNRGELLGSDSRYNESIEFYNKALPCFIKSSDSTGIAYTYNNLGQQYSNLDDYEKAFNSYQAAANIKQKLLENNPSASMMVSLARSYKGMGSSKYYLGQYAEAIEMYNKAIDMNVQSNSIDGIRAEADIFYWLGKANENLGNYTVAAEFFKKQYQYNIETGDIDGQADALDNMAFNTEDAKASAELYMKAYLLKIGVGDTNDAAFSLSNVGQRLWTMGEYEMAIETHNQALQLRQIAGDKSGQAYSLIKLAGLYKDSGDPEKAIKYYQDALALYIEIGKKKEVAEIYADIAETYKNVKDYPQAVEYYKKSIAISELIGDLYQYAYTLFDLGGVYYDEKKYGPAKECYEKSLKIRREIGDKSGQSYNMINIGLIERVVNYNIELAEQYYREGMQIAYETENKDNIAYCCRSLGYHYSSKGQYDSAMYYFNEALRLYRDLNDRMNEASVLISIGYTNESIGEFDVAEKYFNEAYQIAEPAFDRINMSSALTAKGDLKRRYGDYSQALELETRSLQISIEVENKWGIASSYLSFGNTYNTMGEYQKAIAYYLACDSIYKLISGPEISSTPMNNIGTIYYWQGNYDQALSYFMRAQSLLESTVINKDFMALIKGNIGEVYFYKKMYDSAHVYLKESLVLCSETGNTSYQASTHLIMIRLYLEEQKLEDAAAHLEVVSQLLFGSNEKAALAEMNLLFGRYYIQKLKLDDAKNHLNKAIGIVKQMGAKKYLWEPLYLVSDIYRKQGLLDSAIVSLEESVETLEYLKNKVIGGEGAQKVFSSMELVSKVYELMVQMLMEKGDVEGALKYLEKGNNESLRSKFRNLNVAFADSTKNQYISADKDYKTKIETLNQEIEKEKSKPELEQSAELINKLEQIKTVTQNDYRNFITEVVQEEPSLRNYFTMSENPVDFKAQKRNIPEDMAVLLYLLSENHLYIFVGTRDSVFAKVIDTDKSEVEGQIVELYNMIKTPSFTGNIDVSVRGANVVAEEDGQNVHRKDYFMQLSSDLYKLLIEPVAKEIDSKQRLAIIPNGLLYYLPFQVLIKQEEDKTYSYLLSQHSIFYTNRLSYLTNIFYPDESCTDMLAIGNADNTLPYAEVEVKAIEKEFDNAIILVKNEATRKNVFGNASCYNILHFATHGVLDYNNYDNSFLVLAPDIESGDDGKLKIDEVFGLRSIENCKLVTLSACETAVPMELMEGWPITTASAFLQAGVPSVVASLWSVDDRATSILMGKFYANLKTMETLEALHKAQVDMASDEKYSHPYFWAPFLLVGSWK